MHGNAAPPHDGGPEDPAPSGKAAGGTRPGRAGGLFSRALAGWAACGVPLVALAVFANPSGAAPPNPFPGPAALLAVLAGGAAASLALWALGGLGRAAARALHFGLALVAHWGLALGLGFYLHRDWFSLCLPFGILFWARFVREHEALLDRPLGPAARKVLAGASFAVWGMGFLWGIVAAWSLVSRVEPRPQESMLYNVYFAGALALLFGAALALGIRRRTVECAEGELRIDGLRVDALLDAGEMAILRHLLAEPERPLACAELSAAAGEDCRSCLELGHKATACGEFRQAYNRVLRLRKLLEAFGLGTLVGPENRRKIKEEGWRLVLEPRVEIRFYPSSASGSGETI